MKPHAAKIFRLVIAALSAIAICSAYLYFFEPRRAYATYRCVTAAQPWHACFLRREFPFRTDLFGFIYEGRMGRGDYVDEFILSQGSYETHILFFLRDTLAKLAPEAGIFVDVGANSGQHSMFMSRHAKSVHAFEPYPPVLERFRRMLQINAISNVTVHPVGLGHEAARIPFDDRSLAFVPGAGAGSKMALEIVPGDSALEKGGVSGIDLLKMDIEGFEKSALRGLAETLRRDRPVVVFELTIDAERQELFSSYDDLRAVFPPKYEFLVFNKWSFYTGFYELVDLTGFVRFDGKRTYNAVAFPEEKRGQVAIQPAVSEP